MPSGSTGGEFHEVDITTVEPTMDQPSGFNFPYRGTEQHGVAPTAQGYSPTEQWALEQAPAYLEEEEEIRAVPVRIVGESSNEIRGWATGSAVVDGTPRMIAGRHSRRSTVKIKNMSADKTIYIGSIMVNTISGWPIAAGDSESLTTELEVYAISADGSTQNVAILSEFSIEGG